ncbi:ankyrin repeat-containing domain protein [Aspergillus stella-maris]|uniref:ankyrin repeat-containing domain protein n=1 Tax=Aspergillus stella-maris TaxID=1810926 RepID=UPI003CCDD6FC
MADPSHPSHQAHPSSAWAQALESLSEEDKAIVSTHADNKLQSLDDIIASAKTKEAESIKRRWTYKRRDGARGDLHTLFSRAIEKVAQFKTLGDAIAALDPVHMAIPWAVLGLGLQIAVKYSEHSELAHEGVQMLTILVPRYTVFENLYLHGGSQIKSVLQGELVRLYSSIMTFTVSLKRYYEAGTARRIVEGVRMTFDELEKAMDAIRTQQVIVEDLARLIDAERARDALSKNQKLLREALEEFRQPVQTIHEGMGDLVKNMKSEQAKAILDWFSPATYDRHHQSLRISRLQGTGLWIFNESQYKQWRSSPGSGILWLHGQPGTGKSTLMSLIVDSVRANLKTATAGPLAYIYCSRNTTNHEDAGPEAITRSIIKQISRVNPGDPIRGPVVRKYQDIHDQGYGNEVLAFPDTRDLLLDLTDQGTTMIFIDAVDECNSIQQREVFDLITYLLHDAKGAVKILISSRPSANIASQMNTYRDASMIDTAGNLKDLQLFADIKAAECVDRMKLRKIPVSDGWQKDLGEALVSGAQGMFLWVKLQIDILNDPRQTLFQDDFLQRVREVPPGLLALYSAIYEKIEDAGSTMRKIAVTLVRWLLCAEMSIEKEAIISALSMHVGVQSLSQSVILDSCSNLVMVDENLNTFRFIHASARDFFETLEDFSPGKRHATMADVCLRYVTDGVPMPEQPSLKQEPLECFVVLYWIFHVEQVGIAQQVPRIEEALSDLRLFKDDVVPWFRQWLRQLERVSGILKWNDEFKDRVLQVISSPDTAFFAACAFGFVEVARWYREQAPDSINQKNDLGASGLHLAAQYGHLAIVEELLSGKADVDAKDAFGETALIRACLSGREAIVDVLLCRGANARVQGRRFGTALQAAALHGHLAVVRQLISHSVDLEAEGGQFGTALQGASFRGHLHVVKELLSMGAAANAPGGDYDAVDGTALGQPISDGVKRDVERIIEENHREKHWLTSWEAQREITMQLILDRTLDVNLIKSGFGPALHAASRAGREDVVRQLLLVPRIDVDAEGGRYGSALQAAAVGGSVAIMKMLLESNADVNSQNGTYGTPLIAASRRSHLTVAELLLERGAAVDVQAGVYGTALQAAARSGNCDLVRLLLDHHANPNLVAGTYATPLQAAARDGYDDILKLLLARGANPSIRGGSFGTSLQAAAAGDHLSSVKLLFDLGAAIGDALQVACLEGHSRIVKFLLDRGSNIQADSSDFGTPVRAAVTGRHIQLVKFLIHRIPELDEPNSDVNDALQLAAFVGDDEMAASLLARGANPVQKGISFAYPVGEGNQNDIASSMDEDHWSSPLQCAAAQGHLSTVRMLLDGMKMPQGSSKTKPKRSTRGASPLSKGLISAAQYGHLNVVRLFLKHGIKTGDMHSALEHAIQEGHYQVVHLLLDQGVRVGSSVFEEACKLGNHDIMNRMLKERDATVSNLFSAAFHGHDKIVQILLEGGVDINEQDLDYRLSAYSEDYKTMRPAFFVDEHGVTALHGAICGGHAEIVNRLLQHKADVNLRGEHSCTVLQLAAATGHSDILKRLLECGADVNAVTGRYGTALQAAAQGGHGEIVSILVGYEDTDINKRGGEFGTALQAAAAGGHEAIVRQLIQAGADVKGEGGKPKGSRRPAPSSRFYSRWTTLAEGWHKDSTRSQCGKYGTSLQAAAASGNVGIVQLLLDHGADPGDIDVYGQTPLHQAACHGHEAVVSLLLEHGANADVEDKTGRSSLLMAASNGWNSIFTLLTRFGAVSESGDIAGDSPLHRAAANGHISIVEKLLDGELNVDKHNRKGQTALMMAAKHGRSSMIRLLLNRGSGINHRDNAGNTALFKAIKHRHDGVVRLLLTRGADMTGENNKGQTVLHRCVYHPKSRHETYANMLYLLLPHLKHHLEMTDNEGATGLHRLAANRDRDLVEMLLDKGAEPNAKDLKGRTPLHYSVLSRFGPDPKPVISLLLLRGADIHAVSQSGKTVRVAAMQRMRRSSRKKDTVKYIRMLETAYDMEAKNLHGDVLARSYWCSVQDTDDSDDSDYDDKGSRSSWDSSVADSSTSEFSEESSEYDSSSSESDNESSGEDDCDRGGSARESRADDEQSVEGSSEDDAN